MNRSGAWRPFGTSAGSTSLYRFAVTEAVKIVTSAPESCRPLRAIERRKHGRSDLRAARHASLISTILGYTPLAKASSADGAICFARDWEDALGYALPLETQ